MAKRIYLDWNASSPLSQSAFKAMKNSLVNFANPSSLHFEGRKARIAIEKARDKIAEILGLKSRFNKVFCILGGPNSGPYVQKNELF